MRPRSHKHEHIKEQNFKRGQSVPTLTASVRPFRTHTEFRARLGHSRARRRIENKHDNMRLAKVAFPHAAETGLAAEVPQRERRAPAGAAQLFDWEERVSTDANTAAHDAND